MSMRMGNNSIVGYFPLIRFHEPLLTLYKQSAKKLECEKFKRDPKYILPGFHVAKSVKLENLDKTPTLGEITGVLNQYYMNLQPK